MLEGQKYMYLYCLALVERTYFIKSTQIYLKNIEWMVIFKSCQKFAMLMLTKLIKARARAL